MLLTNGMLENEGVKVSRQEVSHFAHPIHVPSPICMQMKTLKWLRISAQIRRPGLPGACSWKMANSVLRRQIFLDFTIETFIDLK